MASGGLPAPTSYTKAITFTKPGPAPRVTRSTVPRSPRVLGGRGPVRSSGGRAPRAAPTRAADPFAAFPTWLRPYLPLAQQLVNSEKGTISAPYDEADRQLQARQSQAQTTLGQYDQQAQAGYAQANAQEKQIADQTQQRLSAINQASTQALDQTQAGANQTLSQDEQLRGQGLGGGARDEILRQIAQSRANQAQGANAAQTFAALRSGLAQGYGNQLQGAGIARGQEGQRNVAQLYGSEISSNQAKKTAALEKALPGMLTKTALNLQSQRFNQGATLAGLNIKEAQVQNQSVKDTAAANLARQKLISDNQYRNALIKLRGIDQQLAGGRLSETQRHNLVTERQGQERIVQAGNRQHAQRSSGASNKAINLINDAWSSVHYHGAQASDFTTGPPIKDAKGHVIGHIPKIPSVYAQAGVELSQHGRLSSGTYHQLRSLGVNVPRAWMPSSGGSPLAGSIF